MSERKTRTTKIEAPESPGAEKRRFRFALQTTAIVPASPPPNRPLPVRAKSVRIKLQPRMYLKRPILPRGLVPAGTSMEGNGKGETRRRPRYRQLEARATRMPPLAKLRPGMYPALLFLAGMLTFITGWNAGARAETLDTLPAETPSLQCERGDANAVSEKGPDALANVTTMAWNVCGFDCDGGSKSSGLRRVAAFLRDMQNARGLDVVALNELNGLDDETLADLANQSGFAHSVLMRVSSGYHLGIVSREPLTKVQRPQTLNPHPSTPNPHPSPLNPQPSTLNPQPSTLNPPLSTLNPQPSTQAHRALSSRAPRGV